MSDRERKGLVLDLDGVLTDTAALHFQAWHDLLEGIRRPHQPSLSRHEYLEFVDGRDRLDGLETLLHHRGLRFPAGTGDDQPGSTTICAVAALKQQIYLRLLGQRGPRVFDDVPRFLERAGAPDSSVVVSASRNAKLVLERAELTERFSVVVDGIVASDLASGQTSPGLASIANFRATKRS